MEQPLAEEPMPEVVSAEEAIQSPNIPAIDPLTMHESEVQKVVPAGPRCSFAYTAASPPVLVGATDRQTNRLIGVVKLHGRLVELTANQADPLEALATGPTFTADGLRLAVEPEPATGGTGRRPANMHFEILEEGLLIGYRGWYSCSE